MNRRLAWSFFLLLTISGTAMLAEPASAAPGGGGGVPGFAKLEDKASEAESMVARFSYVACLVFFIVGWVQVARGAGTGWAMVVLSVMAAAAIANREEIMTWVQT